MEDRRDNPEGYNTAHLQTSQGTFSVASKSQYTLSTDLMTLTVTERRSTRQTMEPVAVFVYRRVLDSDM
jgi:hypothetical protein